MKNLLHERMLFTFYLLFFHMTITLQRKYAHKTFKVVLEKNIYRNQVSTCSSVSQKPLAYKSVMTPFRSTRIVLVIVTGNLEQCSTNFCDDSSPSMRYLGVFHSDYIGSLQNICNLQYYLYVNYNRNHKVRKLEAVNMKKLTNNFIGTKCPLKIVKNICTESHEIKYTLLSL